MLKDIASLTWQQSFLAIAAFLGLIAPGFLIVYQFKTELFLELDFLKLAVFSLAITMPVFLMAFLIMAIFSEQDSEDLGEHIQDCGSSAALLSFFAFYPPLFAAHWIQFSFKMFTLLVAVLLVIVLIVAVFLDMWISKKMQDGKSKA